MTAAAVTSDLMTEVVTFPGVSSRPSKAQRESARTRFPPRQVATDWPTTHQERAEVWEQLTSGMFVLSNANSQERRVRGLAWLLDWLGDQPGETWPATLDGQRCRRRGRLPEKGADRLAVSAGGSRGGCGTSCLQRWWWRSAEIWSVPRCAAWLPAPPARVPLTRNLARIRDPHGFALFERCATPTATCLPTPKA